MARTACCGVAAAAAIAAVAALSGSISLQAAMLGVWRGMCWIALRQRVWARLWSRRGWIGNDLVNFTSTLFAASLASIWLTRSYGGYALLEVSSAFG